MPEKTVPPPPISVRSASTTLHSTHCESVSLRAEERTDARFGNDLMEEVRENIIDQSEGRRYNLELLDARDYRANGAEDNQYEHQPSQQ